MADRLYDEFLRDFSGLESHPGMDIHLSGYQAWCLLSQIQLACRHPDNDGPTRQIAEGIAHVIEQSVATTPALQEVARRGWDPAYDEVRG